MDVEPQTNENGQTCRPNKFKKRSKTQRFLSNAKGFSKRGIYGRGTRISDDQYQYFINILDAMKLGFETEMEKCSMADNVFEQSFGNEIQFASNQIVSKTLESLVGFISEENFSKFMIAFSENFRPICSDSFASHVLQKMIEIAFLRAVGCAKSEKVETEEPDAKKIKKNFDDKLYNSEKTFSDEHRKECSEFVLKIGKFLLNNLEDFVWDTYASHIMRTSILCLSGIYSPKIAFDQNKDSLKNSYIYEVPIEWSGTAKEFAQRIELWPQFAELPYSDITSAFLATLCTSLKQVDKSLLKHFGKKILIESFLIIENNNDEEKKIKCENDDENKSSAKESNENKLDVKLAKVFYSSSSIRLLETLLTLAKPKLFSQLYAMLFPGRISLLALDRNTNFAVQKLIENVKEKVDFESMFDELNEHFEEILKVGNTGVISVLSAACFRLQTKQGAFLKAIQGALHTANIKDNYEQIFKCLLKLKPYEIVLEDKSQFVHLHGSLIIQNILKFNKPIFLVNCILNCNAIELATVLNSPKGSFIADAFLESAFIGEKSREKFIKHMEGTYIDLAITKFGSQIIEKFFEYANEKQRIQIVKELAEKVNQLNSTLFGRLIFRKLRVETYKLSVNEWKAAFNRVNKAEKLFKDIIKN